jgi:hypothetical protein
MVRYVLLNGPPHCGKTTIARELCIAIKEKGKFAIQDSLAAPLKHFIATALGIKYGETNKDRAMPELNGVSIRQFIIALAEEHLRDRYGRDLFARWLVYRSLRFPDRKPDFVIVDDLGFVEEVEAMPNHFIVRVVRPGTSFAMDSRSYIRRPNFLFDNDCSWIDMVGQVGALAATLVEE